MFNIAFTILEEGTKACSAQGNHSIAIFKVSESDYDALCETMQDIITEAKELTNITINGNTYNIEYYLGGDMKFLALVCGIDSATAKLVQVSFRPEKRHAIGVVYYRQ